MATDTSSTPRSSLTFPSPIGQMRVSASLDKLVEVKLGAADLPDSTGSSTADEICHLARAEIEAYLNGDLTTFTVPFRWMGTSFQRSVWREMLKIPAGTTITYGNLARRIGDVGASRAVGVACGANPIPVIVPCHRIVASNGLGGFSGGLERKEWLLKMELTGRPPAPLGSEPSVDGDGDELPSIDGSQQSLF